VVWATGWGFADVDLKRPAGPRTVYNVGSLAKPVTAAAILQAVERGELELDQTLAQLLPELELADHAEQRITLSQLLTHQSGLPSDWFVHELSDAPPAWSEIVEEIHGLSLAHPPGELTVYSNLGMTLAGAALARAGGKPYEQLVSDTLLRPAGMRTAYFPGGPEPEPVLLPIAGAPHGLAAVELAASYRHNQARIDPQLRMTPAGGLRASVLDLAAFASVMLGAGQVGSQRLLSPDSVLAMLSPHNDALARDLDHRFGYAWFLDHPKLDWVGRVAWHGGRTYYQHARIIVLPDHDLAVVVASNSMTAGPAVEALAVETLLAALQEKHGLEPPLPRDEVEHDPAPAPLIEAFARDHAGDYATSTGLSTVTALDPDPDQGPNSAREIWSCTPAGRSRLSVDSSEGCTVDGSAGARVRFVDVEGEHLMALELDGVLRPWGVRLPPPAPIPAAWAERVGRWTVIERPGEASILSEPTLRIVAGRLLLETNGLLDEPVLPIVLVLDPIDDDRARISGNGRGQGTLIEARARDQNGEPGDEALWWAGRELRREP
jgi:CubicO group peptidase (beta-lactamase class C family)